MYRDEVRSRGAGREGLRKIAIHLRYCPTWKAAVARPLRGHVRGSRLRGPHRGYVETRRGRVAEGGLGQRECKRHAAVWFGFCAALGLGVGGCAGRGLCARAAKLTSRRPRGGSLGWWGPCTGCFVWVCWGWRSGRVILRARAVMRSPQPSLTPNVMLSPNGNHSTFWMELVHTNRAAAANRARI